MNDKNDIIKFIIFNLLMIGISYYDTKYGLIIIIFMIIYWITIKVSIKATVVEGYDLYFRDILYLPDFDDTLDYGNVLPTSIQYNSDKKDSSNVFSFFKGDGKDGIIKSDNVSLYEETDELMDELIDLLKEDEDNCSGEYKRGKCSKECGKGIQKVTYHSSNSLNDTNCEHTDKKTFYDDCYLEPCDNDKPCKDDDDCQSGHCENGICGNLFGCDKDEFLYNCKSKKDCLYLNKKYKYENYNKNKYEWDGLKCNQTRTDKTQTKVNGSGSESNVSFKTTTEEHGYTEPELPKCGGLMELTQSQGISATMTQKTTGRIPNKQNSDTVLPCNDSLLYTDVCNLYYGLSDNGGLTICKDDVDRIRGCMADKPCSL
tara:strand:+ start:462 stop:1577 length:1116 start_codon:yes stop_codon:yes gene_type:complete